MIKYSFLIGFLLSQIAAQPGFAFVESVELLSKGSQSIVLIGDYHSKSSLAGSLSENPYAEIEARDFIIIFNILNQLKYGKTPIKFLLESTPELQNSAEGFLELLSGLELASPSKNSHPKPLELGSGESELSHILRKAAPKLLELPSGPLEFTSELVAASSSENEQENTLEIFGKNTIELLIELLKSTKDHHYRYGSIEFIEGDRRGIVFNEILIFSLQYAYYMGQMLREFENKLIPFDQNTDFNFRNAYVERYQHYLGQIRAGGYLKSGLTISNLKEEINNSISRLMVAKKTLSPSSTKERQIIDDLMENLEDQEETITAFLEIYFYPEFLKSSNRAIDKTEVEKQTSLVKVLETAMNYCNDSKKFEIRNGINSMLANIFSGMIRHIGDSDLLINLLPILSQNHSAIVFVGQWHADFLSQQLSLLGYKSIKKEYGKELIQDGFGERFYFNAKGIIKILNHARQILSNEKADQPFMESGL